jgi:hypothetical protein
VGFSPTLALAKRPCNYKNEDGNIKGEKRGVPGLAELTDYFARGWQARHGRQYPHTGAKDAEAGKALLRAVGGSVDEAKTIIDLFFDDADPWFQGKHTLAMLRSQMTRYLEAKGGNGRKPDIRSNERYRHLLPAGKR